MSDTSALADLLQTLEGVIETNERICTALRESLDAHQEGRVLPDAVLEDYRSQLESVLASQSRMRELVATWWTLIAPIRRTEPEAERRTDPAPPSGHGHPRGACSPLTRGRVALRGDALRRQFALAAARHRSSTEIGCGAGQEAIADIAGDAVRTNLNADADQAGPWSGALSIGSAARDSLRDGLATRRDRADSASTPPRRLVESPPASGPTPAPNTRDIEVERGT